MLTISTDHLLQPVSFNHNFRTTTDVLRLDKVHPLISGNKWFKLKRYLEHAKELGKTAVLTFGGPFSNHIIATAAAAKEFELKSIGVIRGEQNVISYTLQDAHDAGMQLYFISREAYNTRAVPDEVFAVYKRDDVYMIDQGGYGELGRKGAEEILRIVDTSAYTHIIAAVATGTTLAALATASGENQKVIGISVMKNNLSLAAEIKSLIVGNKDFELLHDYHFGGFAKYNEALIAFINDFFRQNNVPTDFVYTGKLFYAVEDLLQKNFFPDGSKILIVHSGGLQGNRSLGNRTLIF